jgi:hypothetical protein
VTYRAGAPQRGAAIEQRVRWLAATQIMRIDPPSPELHVIIDYVARRMSVVRDATRSMVEVPAPDNLANMIGGNAATSSVRRAEVQVSAVPVEYAPQGPAVFHVSSDYVRPAPGTAR